MGKIVLILGAILLIVFQGAKPLSSLFLISSGRGTFPCSSTLMLLSFIIPHGLNLPVMVKSQTLLWEVTAEPLSNFFLISGDQGTFLNSSTLMLLSFVILCWLNLPVTVKSQTLLPPAHEKSPCSSQEGAWGQTATWCILLIRSVPWLKWWKGTW